MIKFIKSFFLPILIFISLACNQYTESKNGSVNLKKENNNPSDSSIHNKYIWLEKYDFRNNIANRVSIPDGYERISVDKGSFGDWLRHLPLKPEGAEVHLYNGEVKSRQDVHQAVIDIDAGGKDDLQQCADACMRLRAEYLYSTKKFDEINFTFTSGDIASWTKWSEGYRPKINGNKVSWVKTSKPSSTYITFKGYMKSVFQYCGTYSLSKETKGISLAEMNIGDIFIKGGFPGHAVTIVDMAVNKKTGEKIFMIAQSYMPAQDIHILKNFNDKKLSPWYPVNFGEELYTPEWTFNKNSLKRFN